MGTNLPSGNCSYQLGRLLSSKIALSIQTYFLGKTAQSGQHYSPTHKLHNSRQQSLAPSKNYAIPLGKPTRFLSEIVQIPLSVKQAVECAFRLIGSIHEREKLICMHGILFPK